MPRLENIRPELIGNVRGASRDVRYVHADEGKALANLGKSIAGLGDAAQEGLEFAARLAEERDEANYRNALNQATAEADALMQTEVYEKTGIGAEGATTRATDIYQSVGGKYTAGLSARNQRRFQAEWGSRRNNQVRSVMDFERRQITGVRLNANKGIIENETKNYVATGNADSLERAKSAFEDTFRIQHGGHIIDRKSIEDFDRDVNDGDGKVKTRDGKTLRIVDEAKPGETGVITRSRLKEMRTTWEKVASEYERGLQSIYDGAHAALIDRYLQNNDLVGAESYLINAMDKDNPHKVSAKVGSMLEDALSRKREVVNDSLEADRVIAEIRAKSGAQGQRYGTVEQDELYSRVYREAESRYAHDADRRRRILGNLELSYRALKREQEAALTADTAKFLKEIQDRKWTLNQTGNFIAAMGDGPLKSALAKAHARKVEAFNKQSDPVFLADQEQRLNSFKLALAKGGAELDGVKYNFSDQEQLKAYVLNLGFTTKYQKQAADYISNSMAHIDATLAANELANLLEMDDPAEALARYPGLLNDLEALKGKSVIEGKDMKAWLKSNITFLLNEKVSNYNRRSLDTSNARENYLRRGGSVLDDIFMSKDQLAASWRQFNARNALLRGDTKKAISYAKREPSVKELADFARSRNFVYDVSKGVGRYYLRKEGQGK